MKESELGQRNFFPIFEVAVAMPIHEEKQLASLAEDLGLITKAILQNPSLFSQFQRFIKKSYFQFSPDLLPLSIIWSAIFLYLSKYKTFPTCDLLLALLENYIKSREYDTSVREAYQIVLEAKNGSPISLPPEFISERLRYLIELNYRQVIDARIHEADGKIGELQKIYDEVKHEYIRAISDLPSDFGKLPIDPSFYNDTNKRFPYNVEFVDALLNGGSHHPEVSILLGPTGSGKSFLSLQLCSQWAIANNDPEKVCAYFSYELTLPVFGARLGAQISRMSISEYLQMLGKDPILWTDEEKERINIVRKVTGEKIRVFDFSGNVELSSGVPRAFGSGGIPEVVSTLEQVIERDKSKLEFVIIDWLGAAVTASFKGKDDQTGMIRAYQEWVLDAYREIAHRFNCAVWIVHQIAGSKEKKAATSIFHHSEASWAKNIAQYAFNVLTLGNKDADGCSILAITKIRSGERKYPVFIRFNPTTTLFERVDKNFIPDFDNFRVIPDVEG